MTHGAERTFVLGGSPFEAPTGMAIPHRLSLELHEIFGIEAAEAMADWMNGVDGGQAELRGDIAELRHEMRREFAEVRAEMRAESSALRAEMRAETTAIREEMRVGFAAVHKEIAISKVDVLKWAIGSWIMSLALLAGLLRFSR